MRELLEEDLDIGHGVVVWEQDVIAELLDLEEDCRFDNLVNGSSKLQGKKTVAVLRCDTNPKGGHTFSIEVSQKGRNKDSEATARLVLVILDDDSATANVYHGTQHDYVPALIQLAFFSGVSLDKIGTHPYGKSAANKKDAYKVSKEQATEWEEQKEQDFQDWVLAYIDRD